MVQQTRHRKIISSGVSLENHVQKEQFQSEEQLNKMFSELVLFEDSGEKFKGLSEETLPVVAMRLV